MHSSGTSQPTRSPRKLPRPLRPSATPPVADAPPSQIRAPPSAGPRRSRGPVLGCKKQNRHSPQPFRNRCRQAIPRPARSTIVRRPPPTHPLLVRPLTSEAANRAAVTTPKPRRARESSAERSEADVEPRRSRAFDPCEACTRKVLAGCWRSHPGTFDLTPSLTADTVPA